MKIIRFMVFAVVALMAGSIIFISCQKSSNTPPANGDSGSQLSGIAASDAQAENTYNEVFDNVVGVNSTLGLGTGIGIYGKSFTGKPNGADSISHCFTLTITPDQPDVFPETVTLDFGTTGCTGADGHVRKGKIITVFSGPMSVPGSTATTTFDGYYRDSILVEGTHVIQNNSIINTTTHIFSVTVTDGKLTAPSGNYIAWNKSKTWTQIAGMGTPFNLRDDIYSITGSSNGTVHVGDSTNQWTTTIIQPLIREFTCWWIVQGQKQITWNNFTGLLDYGNGVCDDKATVTINGKVYNITLQ